MSCVLCGQALTPGWVNYGPRQVHWNCYYYHFREQQSREAQLPPAVNQPIAATTSKNSVKP